MDCKIKKFNFVPRLAGYRLPLLTGTYVLLTPLINLFFLLLIFLMIGSSLVLQPGITINLPVSTQEFKSVPYKLVIAITNQNLLYFNDRRLENWEELKTALANSRYNQSVAPPLQGDGQAPAHVPVIIIKADKDVAYDDIVRITTISREYSSSVFLIAKPE